MSGQSNGQFVSDWLIVSIDEPGDHTVRPIPPGPRLEFAKAQRELIRQAEAERKAKEDEAKKKPS